MRIFTIRKSRRSKSRRCRGISIPRLREGRTIDGTYNDLDYPAMGSCGRRFGRNVPLDQTFPDTANLMTPSPRVVSRELMTRDEFQPATILNLMAASWIQFMVHDWFVHKRSETDVRRDSARPGRRLVRPRDEGAAIGARAGAGRVHAAAGLCQPQRSLVGRLADLRVRSRRRGQAADRRGRQAEARSDEAACRSIPTPACT